jgi:hypothetical protein
VELHGCVAFWGKAEVWVEEQEAGSTCVSHTTWCIPASIYNSIMP